MRRDGTFATPFIDEFLDLYRINISPSGIIQDCPFTHVATKTVGRDTWANERITSSLAAAGGVYVCRVSPDGTRSRSGTTTAPGKGRPTCASSTATAPCTPSSPI